MNDMIQVVAQELSLNASHARHAIKLLVDEECTIPFVARYRKEMTGSMDEVMLRQLRERYQYLIELEATKEKYLSAIIELAASKPEIAQQLDQLKAKFTACQTKQELEDLYLPFKPKRRTRAQVAKEKGLEPLLEEILSQRSTLSDLLALSAKYITADRADLDVKLKVMDAASALAGAGDIMAERISEIASLRGIVRQLSKQTGLVVSSFIPQETLEANPKRKALIAKFQNYFDYKEPLATIPAHRVMAVRRGESEKILRLNIEVNEAKILSEMKVQVINEKPTSAAVATWLQALVEDSYKRLLAPSIETEIRMELKTDGENEAIKVFSTNLEHLLLLPPIPNQVVLGVDPGIRTGSKLAAVSQTGKLLGFQTIYPDLDNLSSSKSQAAMQILAKMLKDHQVAYVAIGNGTGSREIDQLIREVLGKDSSFKSIKRLIVNESGASVYSTDEIAREEFPDLDPTIRSAVSIARRLQDPLAELVKIDPKSIGVGQYQHDCHPGRLSRSLKETVESCVNRVGVNVNTASYKLLSYVSGIGPSLAKNIVSFRDQTGAFPSRQSLQQVLGFGPKAFEQAAGFLRIPDGENILDRSSVHPESYDIVESISKDLALPLKDMIGNENIIATIPLPKYVSEKIGLPTLLDIANELKKPGRDPREDGIRLHYSDAVATIDDLSIGMKLKGTVSNVTNFGAFVDIGVHQDGLVHISELSDKFISDPSTVVAVGQVVDVWVLDVDKARQRISLSCKSQAPKTQSVKESAEKTYKKEPGQTSFAQRGQQASGQSSRQESSRQQHPRTSEKQASSHSHQRKQDQSAKSYSAHDLLSKFNTRQ